MPDARGAGASLLPVGSRGGSDRVGARAGTGSPGVSEFARQASIQEAECYVDRGAGPYVLHPTKTRVQETWEFARKMGYKRLGVAFCAGLHEEARTLTGILEAQGFEVVSVVCKVGADPEGGDRTR